LNRYKVFTALAVPTGTLPKASTAGESAVGVTPVAERAALSGLFGAFVVTVNDPAGTVPGEAGVTVSMMVQLEPAASVVPHVPPEMV
jgi:hypothetical protein